MNNISLIFKYGGFSMKNITIRLMVALFVITLSFNFSHAQQIVLTKQLISNGGMVAQTSGNFSMSGNFGQSIAGYSKNDPNITPTSLAFLGYWGPVYNTTGVETQPIGSVSQYKVKNFPNPFSASTSISYELPYAAKVQLRIYDINGNLVKELFNGYQDAGEKQVSFSAQTDNGDNLSSGTYLYELRVEPASTFSTSNEAFSLRNIMVLAR